MCTDRYVYTLRRYSGVIAWAPPLRRIIPGSRLALTPGTRLGPYEIVSALGAGGMGEVYRARDTRLNRTVAIKVLPSEVAGDPDLRSRFEREARAIAALDHPHICGIYDVGSVDSTHYLVMPHLEGQTLAAQLEKGPLPLEQALKIAIEIADALDKAHRQGIIHRDLKPANIMLTKAGPKLLDFGLAKLRDTAGPISMSSMTRLATRAPETAHGMILGTVPYMAPEQVEGKEADGRSDIWALGVVIYEMVTGTRPFQGDTPASVIGAILKDTPPSISTRQPLAPRALNYVAERCLTKDPDERWQSMGDVGRLLGWIAANQAADVERHARPRGARKERTAWFAATTLLLIALAFATSWRRPIAPTGDEVRLSVNPPERMVFAPEQQRNSSHSTVRRVAGWPLHCVCRRRIGNPPRCVVADHARGKRPSSAGHRRCSRAILVPRQPVDWVLYRAGHIEEGSGVRRDGADDRDWHYGFSRGRMGP